MPFSIFRLQTLTAANVVGLFMGTGMFAMFLMLTLYMQQVLEFSPLKTGVGYLAVAGTAIIWANVAAAAVTRVGVKPALVFGMSVMTVGILYFTQVSVDGSYWTDLFPGFLLIGLGLPFAFVPVTIAAVAGTKQQEAGLASGLINTSQQIGGAVGIALLSTIAVSTTDDALASGTAVPSALTDGFRAAFWAAAAIMFAGVLVSVFMVRGRDLQEQEAHAARAGARADRLIELVAAGTCHAQVPAASHRGSFARMRFRKDAKLDPSQVEDYRGRGGGLPGGMPLQLGGGGGIIVLARRRSPSSSSAEAAASATSARSPARPSGRASSRPATSRRSVRPGRTRTSARTAGSSASINSIQAYWNRAFRGYEPTATRLFDGSIQTGCGGASSAVGPFYCPNDRYVYIDLGFFDQLQSQLGAEGGPLAEAYILAHEYGHHVQNLTGVLRSADRDTGPQGGQVRVELQADCYAGLWVGNALETGFIEDLSRQDVAQALDAAASVGDDRIQERTQGRVVPESWTHGSAEQRQSWFVRGIEGSGPQSCDTFKGRV